MSVVWTPGVSPSREKGVRAKTPRKKGGAKCQKETEQAQGAKAPEQVKAWDKAAGAAVEAVALTADLVGIVSAQTAVKKCPIGAETLALRKNAPSVGRQ
jgi:hypothetical protein